ncbi:MAG: High-affinity zinc uptake system protein ZnuA precursor [Betaproteobacteria bacterium ADurb.Bin341]|nr:MAG: High-affinity zinc uptake system protein ZnuA precursor [Betaproteobacteria bacterium ADurb.Bin341]
MYRLNLFLVAFFVLHFAGAAMAAPRVVTSIKPVGDLVQAVMEGVGQPELLIPAGSSPHLYALKPSERLAAEQAEVVFWIGPQVERALVKVLQSTKPMTRIVHLAQAPGIELLPARSGGAWDQHGHAEKGHGKHSHGKHGIDGHLWLSPANAAAIVQAAAKALSDVDPTNAGRYAANAEAALQRLKTLDAELAAQLEPVRDKPFIVFHDAYQYFERSYRLSAAGSVLVSPEAMSSAGRVRDLRNKIRMSGAVCVFAEPQFEPRLVQTLIEGTTARTGTLDPLGAGLPSGLTGYEQLLRGLAENMVACLKVKTK